MLFAAFFNKCLLACGLAALLMLPATAAIPPESKQLVLVVSSHWKAVPATLYRFERAGADTPWQPVGTPLPAVLGKNGLGWGRGLFDAADTNGDFRREGDKRAPAGMFSLGTAFGLATPAQAQAWLGSLQLPYLHLSPTIRCIGDSQSSRYNELVDIASVPRDWQDDGANENMRLDAIRDEGAYRWGIFVNHNHPSNPPGMQRDRISGSCIFVHIWKDAQTGTSGCTGLSKASLLTLLRWLRADRHPILVQLPDSEYQRLLAGWQLPNLPTLAP
ncbi:MAG: L,D-transpeptidase family protein [Candidatus Sericytochromatia bacterium]